MYICGQKEKGIPLEEYLVVINPSAKKGSGVLRGNSGKEIYMKKGRMNLGKYYMVCFQ